MNTAHQRILALLQQQGIEYRLHGHPAVITVEQAHRLVPQLTGHLIKTVVFHIKSGDWILAGIPADERVDYARLASILGVSRRQLRSVPARDLSHELGFEIGGVGPFPAREDCRVILEESLRNRLIVTCGSGLNTVTLELAFKDLVRVSAARLEPIIRQSEGR